MLKQTRQKDLALFVRMARLDQPRNPQELPLTVIIPGFVISELRIAFQIGFLVYLPLLVIDMVVASVLMSMGMLMLPPIMISLPFKLLLFVLVDGWNLLIYSVVAGFHT
jgi:flagellar biosynthetic protein FliP